MLSGLNHLTLAVSDLTSSVDFYHQRLGMRLRARWGGGAYLSCGELWLCLSLDAQRHKIAPEESDYTHYAFSVAEAHFASMTERLAQAGVVVWKDNRSEGASYYFSTRTGTSWSYTLAASRSGWPPAGNVPIKAWFFMRTATFNSARCRISACKSTAVS